MEEEDEPAKLSQSESSFTIYLNQFI